MAIAASVPRRVTALRSLGQAKIPCASCYKLDGMEFAGIARLDLFPEVGIGTSFAEDGSQRGDRATAVFRCRDGCRQKVAISGFVARSEMYSFAGSDVVEYLHIDDVSPAIPLFEIRTDFSPTAFRDSLRLFRLYWNDPTAAMNKVRTVTESLAVDRWFKAVRENDLATAGSFRNWQKSSFAVRINPLFSSEVEKRALRCLWQCGSAHSHFNGDTDSQSEVLKHLDHAISLLHFLLLQTAGQNSSDPEDMPDGLQQLEKFFSDREQEKRLEKEFASILTGR